MIATLKNLAPLATKILSSLESMPGATDRQLTDAVFGTGIHPSQINQECRLLEGRGLLARRQRPDGRIGNYLNDAVIPKPSLDAMIAPLSADDLSEDEVKRHLVRWLEADHWSVEVAWGKTRGADIVARRANENWIIEVKGCGSLQPMRVNYFLAILGETLQRMYDASARYSIALPDMPQFRGLWRRLPELAKERTGITALFVSMTGQVSPDPGATDKTDVTA